jgi:hypothetical protein
MIYKKGRTVLSYCIGPFCVTLILCGIFGIVWLRSNFTTLEYHISKLEHRKIDELRETKMLMGKKASLLSLHRPDKAGTVRLGMVFPDRAKVVYVKENRITSYKASITNDQNGGPIGGVHPSAGEGGRDNALLAINTVQ